MSPDELFARGLQSVRMTGGGSLQSWEPPTVAEAARLFPNYEITEMIGRGGMGVVYKGRQTSLDRMVAIKLLPLEVSIDRDFGDRFVREARTMAKMNHPNIVSVFDFGNTTEGHLYFVMEFVEGTTLHHLIKSVGLKASQALEIIVRVCEALQYAHSEGVIHRDIKPANILVDTKGRVKVTDFGLARMATTKTPEEWGQTMTGMVLGTPDYMAPEQKKGIRVDHRADIYSLGVMLYEMLCGEIPAGIFDPPSLRVAVDERIDQVVICAMQQEPDRRYASSGEMKTAVETIRDTPLPQMPADQVTATVPPPPPPNPTRRAPSMARRRNRARRSARSSPRVARSSRWELWRGKNSTLRLRPPRFRRARPRRSSSRRLPSRTPSRRKRSRWSCRPRRRKSPWPPRRRKNRANPWSPWRRRRRIARSPSCRCRRSCRRRCWCARGSSSPDRRDPHPSPRFSAEERSRWNPAELACRRTGALL